MEYYKDVTQVRVYKSTREKLQQLKIARRETYDEIIMRLINKEGGKQNAKKQEK